MEDKHFFKVSEEAVRELFMTTVQRRLAAERAWRSGNAQETEYHESRLDELEQAIEILGLTDEYQHFSALYDDSI